MTQGSWWGRNWKWAVPVSGLGIVAGFAAFITLLVTAVFGMIKSSYAYEESLAIIRANPEIRAVLGSPVEPDFMVMGNIEVTPSTGHADISYRISGPDGAADVYAVAVKQAGAWAFTSLQVDVESTGERFELTAGPQASADN